MIKLPISLLVSILSTPLLAQTYSDYIKDVHQNSFSVKIAEKNIFSESKRHEARQKYYIPTFNATSSLKSENNSATGTETRTSEIKGTINSRVYATDTKNKLNESHAKVANASIALDIERENLSAAVLKNLINIEEYLLLQAYAVDLNNDARALEQQITSQYDIGTASENDINRTALLVSRIDNEINLIDKQVKLSISNIEALTSMPFPSEGVNIDETIKQRIVHYTSSETELVNNLSYQSLVFQKDIALHVAKQQNPFFTVDLALEHSFIDRGSWENETVLMLNTTMNIFDMTKRNETLAQLASVEAAILRMEQKLHELRNNLQTFKLFENSFIEERRNLRFQVEQTEKLIQGQLDEYAVGRISLYEMLNTRLDLFNAKKQKADVEVQFMQNKIDMMQNSGQLL